MEGGRVGWKEEGRRRGKGGGRERRERRRVEGRNDEREGRREGGKGKQDLVKLMRIFLIYH